MPNRRFPSPFIKGPKAFCAGIFLLACFVLFLVVEENTRGHIANVYGNYYTRPIFFEITNNRAMLLQGKKSLNIAIVVVVEGRPHELSDYRMALKTIICYATVHEYPLYIINFSTNSTLAKLCPHGDFMFRRHCALSALLKEQPQLGYALFTDADMAVINPNHLLEEYIMPHSANWPDLIFADRIFTNEIMAGSYFVRNTPYSRKFLNDWADYFYNLPNSFHGTDNGAIHSLFLDRFCQNCERHWQKLCKRLWHTAQDFDGLSLFTSCVRYILGDRSLLNDTLQDGHIAIVIEFVDFWARDGWMTGNQWSRRDFMLHGWQEKRRDKVVFGRWHSPLIVNEGNFDRKSCAPHNIKAHLNWPYKDTFIKSDDFITRQISKSFLGARDKYTKELESLLNYGLPP